TLTLDNFSCKAHLWVQVSPNLDVQEFTSLCRSLCRNSSIPGDIRACHIVPLGNKFEAGKMRQTRMNTASPCRLLSLHLGMPFFVEGMAWKRSSVRSTKSLDNLGGHKT